MIEIRRFTESWYGIKNDHYQRMSTEPKLQYRTITNPLEIGLQEPIWSEWQDVEDVHINEGEET